MPDYNRVLFDPPAPLAQVTLRDPASGVSVAEVPLLIDSGADVTLLPEKSIHHLGVAIDPTEEYQLMAFDGNITSSKVVRVDLLFLRRTFKGRFLLIQQDWGILGRDILNHVPILLHGPRLHWEEYKPAP